MYEASWLYRLNSASDKCRASLTLAERLNAALGLRIAAIPTMATAGLLAELRPGYQTIGVLVGALDTAYAS